MTSPSNGNSAPADPEPMRYQMIGEDHSTTNEKLAKYTGEVDWSYLKPHYESQALVYVDPSLSLTEVGKAFTEDDAERVRSWQKAGDLVTPSQPHADYWASSEARFTALVVSPFVLIQPIEATP
jgi:hypothetical protein